MDQVADFTTKFYSLDGDTLSERRKNLFMLLYSFKSSPQSVKLEVISGLTPRNHMEVVFRLEVLIFFRCYDALLEILTTEISDITRKILKQRWFIHQLFDSFTPDVFVNEVLPRFSVVNRRRILKYFVKYCKDDQKMNQLFDIILHVYGLDTARLILTSCSVDKIENIIGAYEINVTQRQLIDIYYKDQNLFVNILRKSYNITRRQMQKLRKYVSATHIKYFFDLCKADYTSLGERSTRMFLSKYKSDILQKPLDYMEHIHRKTVGKTLTPEELRLALMNSYADQKSAFRFYPLCRILNFFPWEKRYYIFYETYYEKYNQTLFENPEHMDEDLIEIIEDIEEREKWIVKKVKEGISDTKYIHCYERNKSFNLIKSKINFTSSYRVREVLLEKLVELCKFYGDKELLLETLKYVSKRHRNDEVLSSYINNLFYSFDLAGLNQDHWKYILELLEVAKVKKYYLNPRGSIFLKHIEYLWRNKQPIMDKVIEYLEKEELGEHIFEMKEKNSSLQKMLLSILLELIPQKKQDYKTNEMNLNLLIWILEWNKNNPTDVSDIHNYPTLLITLKSVLDGNTPLNTRFERSFPDFLCTKDKNELGKYLMDIYFGKLEHYKKNNIKIIMWFLKNNPSALSPYTDNLIQFLYDNIKYNHQIWIYIKKLSKYCFLEKAVEYGVENYEKLPKKSAKLLRTLAFLMNSDQYVALVSKYVPSPEIMETENERDERYLRLFIEKGVAKSFIYCRTVNVIPLLLKFCVGETLRDGLNSLYYFFLHSPSNTLREVLVNVPFQQAFAVAQTFSLTCEFDNMKNVISLLDSGLSMGNPFVLKKALKYARKNPSNELFELLFQPKNLESCNARILKIFKKYADIPLQYKYKMVDTVFDHTANYGEQNILPKIGDVILKHLEKDLSKIPVEYKTKFLNYSIIHCQMHYIDCSLKGMITILISNIDEKFLSDVPPEVCISFIDFYFINDAINFIPEELILSFIVCYFCCSSGGMAGKWNFVSNKIKEYASRNSDNLVAKTKTKKRILILFSFLAVRVGSKDIAFIKEFHDLWCKTFGISEGFDIFCFLRISIIVKESRDVTVMCDKLFSLLEELKSFTSLHTFLCDKVASKLKQIYESTPLNNKQSLYSLCFTLYERSKSVQDIAFMLSLLPRKAPDNKNDRKKYFDIIQSLSTHDDQLVKIKYNLFMTNC